MNHASVEPASAADVVDTKRHAAVGDAWRDIGGYAPIGPYANADSLKVLKNPGTWLILVFAFAALPLNQSAPSHNDLAVFVMGYFALAWAAYFYVFVAKRRTNLR